MHRPVTSFKADGQTKETSTTTTNLRTRETKKTSHSSYLEKESTPLRKISGNPFFADFTNTMSTIDVPDVMDKDKKTLTSLGSPRSSTGPPPALSFLVTPPDTPTFETNISQPVPIPYIAPSASCLMTPPDTPTSPSGFSMKRRLVPRTLPPVHDVSFFASTMFAPPRAPADQGQGDAVVVGEGVDVLDVLGVQHQEEEAEKSNCKKPRPDLRLNTKLGSTIIEHLDLENKKEGMDTEIEVEAKDEEEEKTVITREGVPKGGNNNREPLVLCFIGSDLRKIADQFQATYGKVGRILETWSLNFTFSTAIGGCLSVSTLSLSVGDNLSELP